MSVFESFTVAPKATRSPGELARVDDLGERELVLDVLDPPLDERLPVPRGVVLGVLAEIAVLARVRDGLDDRGGRSTLFRWLSSSRSLAAPSGVIGFFSMALRI